MSPSYRKPPGTPWTQASEPDTPQPPDAAGPCPLFDDVYRATFPRVWRLLRRLGVPPRHRPDVAQEAFDRVSRRLSTYDPTVDLDAWVFKHANHAATRHRRLHYNHRELLVDADEQELLANLQGSRPFDGQSQDPELLLADRQLCCLVDQLLQTIQDARVRTVLVLHDFEGMSVADIMRALAIPEATARGRLTRGRKTFLAAVNALDPLEREALGPRRFGVIPIFPVDLVRLLQAEHHVDEGMAAMQDEIRGRLRKSPQRMGDARQATGAAGRPAMGRIAISTGRLVSVGLVMLVVGGVAGVGLHEKLSRPPQEGVTAATIASRDVVSADVSATISATATTPPSASIPGAMAESRGGAAPRRSPPPIAPASSLAGAIPGAGDADKQGAGNPDDDEEEDVLIDRARAHLEHVTPQPHLAIESLRLHARKYPNSPRSGDRESVLRSALALAGSARGAAAAVTTNPTPRERP